MWASSFQNINEPPKSILAGIPNNNQKYNGRINLMEVSPYTTETQMKMFERVKRDSKATDYRGALDNIWEPSKLSTLYFSGKNIQLIQDTLRENIYKQSNGRYTLLPQNVDDLKVIMRGYYLQYTDNPTGKEEQEVKRINKLVLDYLTPKLMTESWAYQRYLEDQSTLVKPFSLSGQQVDRDFKELQYQPFFQKW